MSQQTFYDTLEVSKDATEDQIIASFENKVLNIQSQRVQGQEQVREIQQLIVAFLTLCDTSQRSKYDTFISENPNSVESYVVNEESLKNIPPSVIQALSKLKLDPSSQIDKAIHKRANLILQNQSAEMATVQTVMLNQPYTGQILRRDCRFFLLCVTEEDCSRGLVLECESPNSSNFKLILFDNMAGIQLLASSSKTFSKKTIGHLFFTPFQVSQDCPSIIETIHDSKLPYICKRIQNFGDMRCRLTPGTHLFCICNENLVSSAKYQLMVYLIDPSLQLIPFIAQNHRNLMEKKEKITELEQRYISLKKEFEETEEIMKKEAEETDVIVSEVQHAIDEIEKLSMKDVIVEEDPPRTITRNNSWRSYIPGALFRSSETSQPQDEKKN